MPPQYLVPETVARQDGAGGEVSLAGPVSLLRLTLGITRSTAQESLEVSVWGSADSEEWHHLVTFPQKFYCGTYSIGIDLNSCPGTRYLRARWKMARWLRDDRSPLFGFYVLAEE